MNTMNITKKTLILQFIGIIVGLGILFLAYEGVKSMRSKNENITQNEIPESELKRINEEGEVNRKNFEKQKEAEIQERVQYEVKRREMQSNWRDLLRCEKSGGEYLGIAGGFHNVTIRVFNDSEYSIDEVIVKIFIFNGFNENKLCHSEILKFHNISSEAEKSIKYSHVECGQRMEANVIGYSCKKLKTSYDPFKE